MNLNQPGTQTEPGIEINFDNVRLTEEPRRLFLTLRRGASNAVAISWVDVSGRFALQRANDLTLPFWQEVSGLPPATNGTNQVTLSVTNAATFFRLLAIE